jgi:uncharacterized protein YdeI (YjbR/CyaY-like superfamily)
LDRVEGQIMTKVPKDFSEALKKNGLADYFAQNAPSHQKEYLKWVTEAKKPETRAVRIAKAMKMLAEKRAQKDLKSRAKG